MIDTPTRFGFPNTLPPLARRDLRACFVFAGMGLFVLLVGLFPGLRPPPRLALPLALCWLALPAWGLFKFLTRKARGEVYRRKARTHGTGAQVRAFTVIMIGLGIGFYFWARHLHVTAPVIFGSLLIIEGLGGMIVSLTEWWRLSHIGVSLGLMAGGFLLPFAAGISVAVPVGAAFLLGSLVSAVILCWQLRHQRAESGAAPNGSIATPADGPGASGGPSSVS